MNNKLEKIIKFIAAPLGIVLASLSLIYGAILPFRKSQLFIQAMHQASQSRSVVEYMGTFNKALDFYSPVGQAEDIRFLENQIGSIVAQKPPQQVADALVMYADSISRVTQSGKHSSNFVQEIVILGSIHETNFRDYKEQRDYDAALALFEKGLILSPKRPQFLYGLLQLYSDAGEQEKAEEAAKEILSIWPNDERVQKIISSGQGKSN